MVQLLQHLALFWLSVLGFSLAAIPLTTPVLMVARIAPPYVVALIGCSAVAVGAVIDYHLVRRGFDIRALARVRDRKLFKKAESWAKVAPFLTSFAFSSLPLPYVVIRVLMPLSGYPLKKYVAAVTLGRFCHVFVIAAFGVVFDIPMKYLIGFLAGSVVLGLGTMIYHHVRAPKPAVVSPPARESQPGPG